MSPNESFRKSLRSGFIPYFADGVLKGIDYSEGVSYSEYDKCGLDFNVHLHSFGYLNPLIILLKEPSADDVSISVKILFNWAINNCIENPQSEFAWIPESVRNRIPILIRMSELLGNSEWILDVCRQHLRYIDELSDSKGLASLGRFDEKGYQRLKILSIRNNPGHNSSRG